MYCRAIATDLDGTSAAGGSIAPEVLAALAEARERGIATILVTGRVHEDTEALCGDLSAFDAVVSENGAVTCISEPRRTIRLGSPPPERFLGELRTRGIPFHVGSVVLGTWDRHAHELLDLVRRHALDSQLVFNREALMLLPSGINKATGVQRALAELRRSPHNLVVFGDAENDLPLFALAEVAVAAHGAAPEVAAQADEQLRHPGPAGVARYIRNVVDGGGYLPTPRRHRVPLSSTAREACLPASGAGVLIAGGPRSGKSWLVGLIAEQLLDRQYRLCIVDPEGDHLVLAQRADVLGLGEQLTLPEPASIPELFKTTSMSLVLGLTRLAPEEQERYVARLLPLLEDSASVFGIPHWVIIDEVHYSLPEGSRGTVSTKSPVTYAFATYRPSLLDDCVWSAVRACLVTETTEDEQRYFLTKLLQARGPTDLSVRDALSSLQVGVAGLLVDCEDGPTWHVFPVGERQMEHTHHARKYVDTRLPDGQAFWFLKTGDGPVAAHNVAEFYERLRSVPISSLRHHLASGDFSAWAAGVLGDERLARDLRKCERRVRNGADPDREEILAQIESYYRVQPDSGR